MDSGVNKLAKLFKKLEPSDFIGPVVGEIVKAYPELTISILNGQVILFPDQLYINDSLLSDYEREISGSGDITLNDKTESAMAGVTGQATESPTGHAHDIKLNGTEYTNTGKIKFTDSLKVGDLVKVSPTSDEQTWFVDYKIKKVE